ncbi:MAG: YkgJ family cysteine cluster protein [Lachnospiraceae bacterium]|nr:YkgJ family cysteine cluster protein [Lachnospiraceae bacterium]
MIRECNLEDISDGKRYTSADLVKVGCNDCEGCHACCTGMGDTICLDPYDVCRLSFGTNRPFASFLEKEVGLHVEEGVIIPHLLMGDGEACSFLNGEGRCSIHPWRPGICRLFPLGRVYEDEGFSYFLQADECVKTNRTKEKIKNWLDTPELKRYEAFILTWHNHIKEVQHTLQNGADAQKINMEHLQLFYLMPYASPEAFYEEFETRLAQWNSK